MSAERDALRHPDVQAMLLRVAVKYVDLIAGDSTAPAHYFFEQDDACLEALEEALVSVQVIPYREWAAEKDLDEAADLDRDRSVGM